MENNYLEYQRTYQGIQKVFAFLKNMQLVLGEFSIRELHFIELLKTLDTEVIRVKNNFDSTIEIGILESELNKFHYLENGLSKIA